MQPSAHDDATVASVPQAESSPVPYTDDTYACPCTHDHEPTLLSFEVMPPRKPSLEAPFWKTVDSLLSVRPDFMSVTYGAGGKDRSNARSTVHRLIADTPIQPIAHLTCVGNSTDEVVSTVYDYLDSGVRTFLALRGDPPAGENSWEPGPGGVGSATELIHLIRTVEKRRCDAHPGEALRSAFKPLTIAVAAFPAGNPAAGTTPAQEVERLLVKQAAGASFAITQLFWDADVYASFVERARRAGVTLPIVPGLLPATDPARLRRVQDLTGIEVPGHILDALSDRSDQEARYAFGAAFGSRLFHAVIDAGAPGVHLYTFNQARPVLDILALMGVGPDPDRSPASPPDTRA